MTTPTGREVALKALEVARGYAHAGVHEEGGNNRGDQVDFFNSMVGNPRGSAWCAAFVSTCLVKGYVQLVGGEADRASLKKYVHLVGNLYVALSGYCPTLWLNFKAKRLTRQRTYVPKPGDVVFYDFRGQGEPHHVGIVKAMGRDGLLATVEGNTPPASGSGDNQGDGDGVYPKVRTLSKVFGFGVWE